MAARLDDHCNIQEINNDFLGEMIIIGCDEPVYADSLYVQLERDIEKEEKTGWHVEVETEKSVIVVRDSIKEYDLDYILKIVKELVG